MAADLAPVLDQVRDDPEASTRLLAAARRKSSLTLRETILAGREELRLLLEYAGEEGPGDKIGVVVQRIGYLQGALQVLEALNGSPVS